MVWKQVWKNYGILIRIALGRKTKQWHREIWKNPNFVPKDAQRIYHQIKFWKSTKIWRHSIKKLFLKIWQLYTGKQPCCSLFFNNNADIQVCTFIKKRLQLRCFLDNIYEIILRTAILRNICEKLVLRVFLFTLLETFPYMNK